MAEVLTAGTLRPKYDASSAMRKLTRDATRGGFGLIELLLSLAIMAMLLAAVSAAIHTSLKSYQENQKIAAVTQSARSILDRMMRDVRTAAAVDSAATELTIIPPDDGSGLEQLKYDFTGGVLYYRRTVSGQTTSHVLLGSGDEVTVSDFTVTREVGQDWQGTPCTKSITASLSLAAGGYTFSVTASAAPRRNQLY